MDNQHTLIKGYRDLSKEEIDAMNAFKNLAQLVGDACNDRRQQVLDMPVTATVERAERAEALRWLEAGEMQAQQAFMALIRSIARPTTF